MTTSTRPPSVDSDSPDKPAVLTLASPTLTRDPVAGYSGLRESGPLVRGCDLDGVSPMWFVTRYDDVKWVLSDPRFVTNPPGGGSNLREKMAKVLGVTEDLLGYMMGNMLDSDPPDHTRLRRLVTREFTVRRMAALRPRIQEISDGLLAALPGKATDGVVELNEAFAYPLTMTVICELVGVPEEDREQWGQWTAELHRLNRETFGVTVKAIVDYIHALIERRRAEPAGDLLSGLVKVRDEDGDRLSDVELVAMVLALSVAGHENTANMITNGIAALLTHPDQLDLLRAKPELWPQAVDELLRWAGSVHVTRPRYASVDVEIGGVMVRAGESVQPLLTAADTDPRRFDDPERLDINRVVTAAEQHVAFGAGLHYCLGAALARSEIEIAIGGLFREFPDVALAVDADTLAWKPIPGLRRLTGLRVQTLGGRA